MKTPAEAAKDMEARYGLRKAIEMAGFHRVDSALPEYWVEVQETLKAKLQQERLETSFAGNDEETVLESSERV